MYVFGVLLSAVVELLQTPIVFDGFSFSLWNVMIFVIVVGIILFVIGGFFDGGD
jgi:hypothetical protein